MCLGRDVLASTEDRSTPRVEEQTIELLLASADAAKDLARIERTLDAVGDGGEVPGIESLEIARDGLVQRLLEATAALTMVRSASVSGPDGVLPRLANASKELREELEIQLDSLAEVRALTRGDRGDHLPSRSE
jgi:hypothetical protein